jgi:hypothetical protein
MKVKKGEAFFPITITLETEEEAEVMWHILNNNRGISEYVRDEFPSYSTSKKLKLEDGKEIRNIKDMFWKELNAVFKPSYSLLK